MNSSDTRLRRFIVPTRIVWENGPLENPAVLLQACPAQALVSPPEYSTLRQGASILLDFGRELNGALCLVTGVIEPHGRARLGESVSEAMGAPDNDHANHDFEIELPTMGASEWGVSGFRFARLDLLSDHTVPLLSAQAVSLLRPMESIGAFECSDEKLNRIWEVGADTVHLCAQDFLWDGIKRDRLVWCGDLNPAAAVVSAVWGAHEIVPQTLDFARDTSPLPRWMNGMVSYSIWWLVTQREWFQQHGDRTYFDAQQTYASGVLRRLLSLIGQNSESDWSEGALWVHADGFLDWPSSCEPNAVRVGMHALMMMALQNGRAMAALWNDGVLGEEIEAALETLQAHRPALIESHKASVALLALSGLHSYKTVNAEVLARDPLRGVSMFYGLYIARVRAKAGDLPGALEMIRQIWGAMLDLGATSFWEHFEIDWMKNAGRIDELPSQDKVDLHATYGEFCYESHRNSLCHAWVAGPTAFLSRAVLGVEILEVGCRRVRVRPDLGDLEWAQGRFPTPFGALYIRHEKCGTEIVSHIEAPSGVCVELERACVA